MASQYRVFTFLVLCFHLLALAPAEAQKPNIEDKKRQDVYIAGFFPFGRGIEQSNLGRGVMPSVKLALDHVNDHNGVLRNYRLHMWWNDTECNAAVGVKSFFDMMHSGPHKLMLFGAACTHVTDPIAKASKHWRLTQLSYADTHPMFTKDSFPNFFRIVPSENAFNLPRLALLRQFNWTFVGTVYQNEPRYSLAHNRLVADLDSHGFHVVETQSFATEVRSALEKLKEKDVRIILGNFNESWAVQIFCEAYKLDMYGRAYQWLIMGTYSDQWWTKHEDWRPSCNESDIMTSLESAILTDLLPLSTTGDITISGITASEYKVEYDSRRGMEYSRFHGYTYDGIWAVAMAIQHVAQKIKLHRKNKTVVDFKYRDTLWEQLFLEALRNISFEGVTGPVRFYDNERRASILLKQFQSDDEVKVGEYCSELNRLDFSMGEPLRWIGRYPPKDRTVHIIEHSQVNITIYAILASCSVVGIILAIFFLVMNITYRNQRYIKMSSPHLNNLIIIGCMLCYMSVIFLGLDSGLSSIGAFPYICTARAWLLMAGFSLAFGAMFSKTWRVHSIFTDVKLNKKVIKDYQLFMVVGVLLVIDLAIMATWQISDPFYRETKQMDPYPHPSSEDILIIRENEYCQSERMTIFVGVIYAYKGLLMIFGAFLAWETRNVSIPALNDSKHVGMSVYNVVIMCVMGAPIALVLADHKDAVFILISVFIIFCTTATLCLVFVPKLVELRRNKKGGSTSDKRIRATLRTVGGGKSTSGSHSPPPAELERRLREQRATNSRYRKALQAKESELQMLMGKLGADAPSAPPKSAVQGQPNQQKLGVPSIMDTSDITSLCSLTASQGVDDYYYMQQMSGERTKEVSMVSNQSSQGDQIEAMPAKKEPGTTKNVSFKNHTDSSPNSTYKTHPEPVTNARAYVDPIANNKTPTETNNAFRGHTEVLTCNGSRPVLEKDQLAKSPYGWRQDLQEIPPPKQVTIAPPPYHKAVQQETPEVKQAPTAAKAHRRMSSIGQPALITDAMQTGGDHQAPMMDSESEQQQQQRGRPVGGEKRPMLDQQPQQQPVLKKQMTFDASMMSRDEEMDDLIDGDYDMSTAERRRLSQRRDSEKRKSNYIVAQSDLWDTSTFTYTGPPKQPSHHHSPIQRSVSERSQRHHSHGTPPTPTYSQQRDSSVSSRQSTADASSTGSGHQSQRGTPERKSSNASIRDQQQLQQYQDEVASISSSGHFATAESSAIRPMTPTEQVHRAELKRQESQQQQQSDDEAAARQRAAAYKQQMQLFTQGSTRRDLGQQQQQQQQTSKRVSTPGSQGRRGMAHHLSTPDVQSASRQSRRNSPGRGHERSASRGHSRGHSHGHSSHHSHHGAGSGGASDRERRMHAASSESELFECAILPIFQKLLSERHRSQPHGLDVSSYGLSCPNISIKCDIVEYL